MIGLIDTHSLLWAVDNSSKLSQTARSFVDDPTNSIIVSVASLWEIAIKNKLGKLPLKQPIDQLVVGLARTDIRLLEVRIEHVVATYQLPDPHRDPFDRMLAAQAIAEGAVLVTDDPIFAHYPVTVVW